MSIAHATIPRAAGEEITASVTIDPSSILQHDKLLSCSLSAVSPKWQPVVCRLFESQTPKPPGRGVLFKPDHRGTEVRLELSCAMSQTKVSAVEITDIASKAGLKLEDGHAEDYSAMTNAFEGLVASLGDDKALFPIPDLSKYPRTDIHIPDSKDTDGGGWATRVSSSSLINGLDDDCC